MVTAIIPRHSNTAWRGTLSPREAEVLELVAAGMTNPQIARELWISEQTVKYHLSAIYLSLGIRSKTTRDGQRAHDPRVKAARWWWENVERSP